MNREEIVEKLAREKSVETIIDNITKSSDDTLKDLAQMIYLQLLEKPADKIERLYNDNQLSFFITRMVMNNVYSRNSRYYYLFRKYELEHEEIKDFNIPDEDD